ncbi:hypothetical protein E0Z10_g9326 [Xylaria hypoxylon]|uniref:Uncharacterized protein n=1 Tax=Xylaria hypoxylon TaxID=37992 RepID=A0A4Z0YHH7_9PEZI|nr:hypothetical protein E0Z10_g9326 [Xylaria hypoxylon]
MDPTDIWVMCGFGTLSTLHYLRFLQAASRKSSSKTEAAIWIFWMVYAGVIGAYITMEGLMAMADQKPDMKLGVSVIMAVYMAHLSIMHMYFTDSAPVHISRFLFRAIVYTWIVAQAEYRWAVCTRLVHFLA